MDSGELNREIYQGILKREREVLRKLLEDHSDEIPEQMLHGENESGGAYKVRTNWFHGVIIELGDCLAEKIITDQNLFNEIFQYCEKTGDQSNPKGKRRTTREEIDEANNLLRKTIIHLDSQIN